MSAEVPSSTPLLVATGAGAACLAMSGPFGVGAAALVVLGGLLGRRWLRGRDATPLHLVVLAVCGATAWGVGVVEAFALLLGWLAAHRVAVLEGRADARVLLLLATLMALIGSVGTLSVGLAPALLAYAVATPVALLRAFGVRRGALEGGMAAATVLLAAGFFLLVPRLQGSLISGVGEEVAGDRFSDTVQLGDELDDPDAQALVLRATVQERDGTPVRGPLYFRGRALDVFDGRAWRASGRSARVATGAWNLRSDIVMEPIEGRTVFGPPDVIYAKGDGGPILQGGDGSLAHGQPGRRVSLEVYSRTRTLSSLDDSVRGYRQLPALDPRIAELAASIAPGESDPRRVVVAAARHLGEGYGYDRKPGAPAGDPLAWFLFESRRGHCEYFASALAVILRSRGIPARLATGFYSAEYNDAGGYIAVRRGHAHAWVEVPVDGGWAVVDATPVGDLPSVDVSAWVEATEAVNSAWLRLVLDYDIDQQWNALSSLGSPLVTASPRDPVRTQSRQGLAGAGVVLGLLVLSGTLARLVIWFLSRPGAASPRATTGARWLARARALVHRRLPGLPAHLPALELAARLRELGHASAEPFESLARLVYAARYGGEPADAAEAARLLRAICDSFRSTPGRGVR